MIMRRNPALQSAARSLVIVSGVVLLWAPRLRAGMTADEVLKVCDKSLDAVTVWSMQVQVVSSREQPATEPTKPVITRATYLRDGDRRYIDAATGERSRDPHIVAIINGYFIKYDLPSEGSPRRGMYSANGSKLVARALDGTMAYEGALEGRLATPDPVTVVLRNSIDTRVTDERSLVDGEPCVVVTGSSKLGRQTAWLDPKLGYWPRQMMLVKSGNDLFGKQRTADVRLYGPSGKLTPLAKLTFTADAMRFQAFGNVTLPISCHVSERYDFADGTWAVRQIDITREKIDLQPEISPHSFDPRPPDGTALDNQDDHRVPYEWRDGKPSPLGSPRQ